MSRDFTPDYRHIVCAAQNRWPDRLPLYEHIIGGGAMKALLGRNPYEEMESSDPAEQRHGFGDFWDFWRRAGYDTASFECCVTPVLPGNGALGGHQPGSVHTREDFEKYPWEDIPQRYFNRYDPYFRALAETCPPGMKAVGGVGNGVFEAVQDIVGYTSLCYMKADDPELYAVLFARMGRLLSDIWERFLAEYGDVFCVMRFGDDLGFNTSTLLPPVDIRAHILPVYRQIIGQVHRAGKPFLLHSCGNLFGIFEDVLDTGIDAKHSNEDGIAHFSVWVERYGDRIGNFGGVDTDVLCRRTPEEIRLYVLDCLNRVAGHGGIAFGSGNSIPDYVPPEGFFAMTETVREWREDHGKA